MGMYKGAITDKERIKEYEGIELASAIDVIKGYVKVGTEYGSGFVFAGTVEEYKESVNEVDATLRNRREKKYRNAEGAVKRSMVNAHTAVEDYICELHKASRGNLEEIHPTFDGYMAFVKRRLGTLSARSDAVAKARVQLENFKPSGKRIVKRAYAATTSFDPDNTIILVVEGGESGEAWTVAEYKTLKEKERLAAKADKDTIPFDSDEYDEVFGDDA